MSRRRHWRTASLLALLMSGTGCTIVSTVISPVTGTIDAFALSIERQVGVANALWLVPLAIVLSPVAGLLTGLSVDASYMHDKDRDEEEQPLPVWNILRPWKNFPTH